MLLNFIKWNAMLLLVHHIFPDAFYFVTKVFFSLNAKLYFSFPNCLNFNGISY